MVVVQDANCDEDACANVFQHTCTTWNGQSGSAMWTRNDHIIRGIVTGSALTYDGSVINVGIEINDFVYDTLVDWYNDAAFEIPPLAPALIVTDSEYDMSSGDCVHAYHQCGGTICSSSDSSNCPVVGLDSQWACCSSDSHCMRYGSVYWECVNNGLQGEASAPMSASGTCRLCLHDCFENKCSNRHGHCHSGSESACIFSICDHSAWS